MLAPSGDSPPPTRVRQRAGMDVWSGWLVHQVESFELTGAPSTLPTGRRLPVLLVQVRLRFPNVYARCAPYVSAVPVRCRKVVYPGGLHGKAW